MKGWARLGASSILLWALAVPALQGAAEVPLRALYTRPVSQWPPATVDNRDGFVELGALQLAASADAAKAALGRQLFHDPLLSRNADMACATCHNPARGWADGAPLAVGAERGQGARNVPSLFNAAYRQHWGWDGRSASLAAQSLRPLTDGHEMANPDIEAVLARLGRREDYGKAFTAAFSDPVISADRLSDALVAFQAGLEEPTRFDAFLRGDGSQLTDQQIQGLHLFRTKARCANCHFGPLLTDERFHNLGLSAFRERSQDLGRYNVTGQAEHAGQFRTPSLRHVGRTAPYMHSGLFASLEGVVRFYMRGGGEVWARNEREALQPLYAEVARIAPLIHPLELSTDEQAALVAFLRAI